MSRFESMVASLASRAGLSVSRTSSLHSRLPIEATAADRATTSPMAASYLHRAVGEKGGGDKLTGKLDAG